MTNKLRRGKSNDPKGKRSGTKNSDEEDSEEDEHVQGLHRKKTLADRQFMVHLSMQGGIEEDMQEFLSQFCLMKKTNKLI